MKTKGILAVLFCLPLFAAEVQDLGALTTTNQIALGQGAEFVVSFESLEKQTNIYTLLAHREPWITREDVPPFLVGKIRMSVSSPGTETNVYKFEILKPAPRARLSRRYPNISPSMPFAYTPPQPLPGGTNMDYQDWQRKVHMRGPTRQRRPD